MAGSITISSITLDSDNNFSIKSNTGSTILSANGTGLLSSQLTTPTITGNLNFDTTGTTGFNTATANTVRVHTAGVEAFRIDSSQNVGIGTSSPSYKLDVQGTTANQRISSTTGTNAAYQIFSNTGQNFYVGLDNSAGNQLLSAAYGATLLGTGAYPMVFGTNNTERMRIDSSGNVGIGTTSPTSLLTVHNGSVLLRSAVTTGALNSYTFGFSATAVGGAAAYLTSYRENANDASALVFGTWNGSAAGERMRIDSSGNLLVGQTSQTGSEKIGVTQSGATSATAYFYATAGNYSNAVITSRCARGSATTEYNFLECSQVSSLQLVIRANGNVVNTNNSYGSISDIKLKENITDAKPKLADLMQVKVRNYNLKTEPDHKQLGVIAQELEQVFPSMIEEAPDKDEEGNDLGTTTKSVKYSVFIPMLIKSIQELKALVDAQATEIAELKSKVA